MSYYSTKKTIDSGANSLLAIRAWVGGANVRVARRARQTRGGRLVACDRSPGLGRGGGGGSGGDNYNCKDADGEIHGRLPLVNFVGQEAHLLNTKMVGDFAD
jgi:hypothetical protein